MSWEQILPRKLFEKSHYLYEQFGVSEYAWTYEDILSICLIIQQENLIILGGDVYAYANGTIQSTYDSWCYEGESSQDSVVKTIEYMNRYVERNGENFLFVLVVRNQKSCQRTPSQYTLPSDYLPIFNENNISAITQHWKNQ
ncbi:MAG: Imm40 family immunity protein [Aerococcaceae bacterium]|nr:Imm40 family immunity protein [Aerococcaceae bacterium]